VSETTVVRDDGGATGISVFCGKLVASGRRGEISGSGRMPACDLFHGFYRFSGKKRSRSGFSAAGVFLWAMFFKARRGARRRLRMPSTQMSRIVRAGLGGVDGEINDCEVSAANGH
jgi:hypothetical protein